MPERHEHLAGTRSALRARPEAMRLSSFARSVGRSRRLRCALPGCSARGAAGRCCPHPLCLKCLARCLRTALDERFRIRCPFCRTTMRVPVGAVKRLMAAACPTHATTIECDGGPPAVIAHFRASKVTSTAKGAPCGSGQSHRSGWSNPCVGIWTVLTRRIPNWRRRSPCCAGARSPGARQIRRRRGLA